jgi:hypothetical protein
MEMLAGIYSSVYHLHWSPRPLPCLDIFKPLDLHSSNSMNSRNSMNSFNRYRFCQIARFVGVTATIDSEMISQELKRDYGDHRV